MEMAQSFQKEKQFEKAISCLEQAQQYAVHHQNVNAQVLLVTTFPPYLLTLLSPPSPLPKRLFLLAEAQVFLMDLKVVKARGMLTELEQLVARSGEAMALEQQTPDETQRIAAAHVRILYHHVHARTANDNFNCAFPISYTMLLHFTTSSY